MYDWFVVIRIFVATAIVLYTLFPELKGSAKVCERAGTRPLLGYKPFTKKLVAFFLYMTN